MAQKTKNDFISFLKEIIAEWQGHDASLLASSLAFFSIFSIGPLVMLIISLFGLFVSKSDIEVQILSEFRNLLGNEGTQFIETTLKTLNNEQAGIISSVISFITLLFGATGFYINLRSSFDRIWEVEPDKKAGIFGIIKDQVFSAGLVISTGLLLLLSLVVTAAINTVDVFLEQILHFPPIVFHSINLLITIIIVVGIFMLVFKYIPHVEVNFSDVFWGAVVTTILFVIGKYAIGAYLGNSSYTSGYGTAGSLIVFLLWVFYTSQILFFGVAFTKAYTYRYGSRT
jgi:membrane protein